MGKYIVWSLKDLCEVIQQMIDNKFDCNIIIDGKRGLGKSTLGSKIFYRLGFTPWKDIVYSREDVIKAFATKHKGRIFADEMINVSYGRDFWDSDQKTLIKIMNMYRDSCNVFIGCVPVFAQLDKHFQSLIKIRLTVISRGVALIQRQLSSIYTNDPWDIKNNQKLESKWLARKGSKPTYSQLSTFIGVLKFSDLTPNQREEIDKVKAEKRSKVVQLKEGDVVEENAVDRIFDRVIKGTMTTQLLRDFCNLTNQKYDTMRNGLNRKLKTIPEYANTTLQDLLKKAEDKLKDEKPKKKFSI